MNAKVEQVIEQLAADDAIRSLARPSGMLAGTTQNDYGYYLGVLPKLARENALSDGPESSNVKIWAIILMEAGGNALGIRDALRAGYGMDF